MDTNKCAHLQCRLRGKPQSPGAGDWEGKDKPPSHAASRRDSASAQSSGVGALVSAQRRQKEASPQGSSHTWLEGGGV